MPAEEMFDVKPATVTLPEPAKIFASFKCKRCGETTGSNWIRMLGEKKVCLDCYHAYDRFTYKESNMRVYERSVGENLWHYLLLLFAM